MMESQVRAALLSTARKADTTGLNRGTSGNMSVRLRDGFLITPSGVAPDAMSVDDLVCVRSDGTHRGRMAPSSEWLFHRDVFAARADVHAVVHTHSPAATALSCLRQDLPRFHYMVAVVGGDSVRCARYATFGTQALSTEILSALGDRKACLMANHGMVAVGTDLRDAFKLAVEVESLCDIYLRARAAGEPVLLTPEEFRAAQDQFAALNYGAARKRP